MKKSVFWTGIILLLVGIIFEFLSGATLPGNVTIPIIYGSNQIMWLFLAVIGVVVTIVGLIVKSKK